MRVHRRALLATGAAALAVAARAAEPSFISGYAGALPKDARDKARTYFNQPAVKALIADLAQGPLSEAEAARRLAGSQASLDDLVRLKLVRREAGVVRLGFAYFALGDMALIHRVAADYAPRLAAAYRRRGAELDAIWRRYPVASVDPKVLAFCLICGVGLNWDGLDILFEGGWRKPILVSGPDWRYSFFAEAETPGWSYTGYYWGSSAFPADLAIAPPMPAAFASFGDPDSDPRMNLPDLMGLTAKDMTPAVRAAAEKLGFRDDPMVGPGVLGVETGRQLGRLLINLRLRPASEAQLAATAPAEPVPALLGLLEAADYARREPDGRFVLTMPVLIDEDGPMLAAARALNRSILQAWFKANSGAVRARLSRLSALRQGVAYEGLFTQIWHELFGLTTRELVKAGVTADPRAPGTPSPGSLSLTYRPSLIQRVWR